MYLHKDIQVSSPDSFRETMILNNLYKLIERVIWWMKYLDDMQKKSERMLRLRLIKKQLGIIFNQSHINTKKHSKLKLS